MLKIQFSLDVKAAIAEELISYEEKFGYFAHLFLITAMPSVNKSNEKPSLSVLNYTIKVLTIPVSK